MIRLLVMLVACNVASFAWAVPDEALRERIDLIRYVPGASLESSRIFSTRVLPELYERRDFTHLWSRADAEAALLEAIRNAHRDGLDPADYHLEALSRPVAATNGARASRDILLTDAFLALLYHLRKGKVDPVSLDPNWNYGGELTIDDTTLERLEATIERGAIEAAVQQARPGYAIYDALRSALASHQDIERTGGWPRVPEGPTLKTDMRDPRVLALRSRLAITDEAETGTAQDDHFDESLVEAVRRFQRRHRIAADGDVGPATLRELNVSVASRIEQLRVNLERVRWTPEIGAPLFVLVDVAGFRVALVRDGSVAWRARAVVGRPYRRTPIFGSQITYVVVNPTWTVPPGILGKDTLPAIRRDPDFLAKQRMEVIDRNGRPVDPVTIDFDRYTGGNFPHMIRQRPGPQNALGLVKIMFPNEHLVYLHDTPARALFERDERAFSSGCIRIERPFELVELLLADPRWDSRALDAVIASGQTRTIPLTRAVPVVILYWTAEVDELGRHVFKRDIYDRDPALLAALNSEFVWGQRTIERSAGAGAAAGAVNSER